MHLDVHTLLCGIRLHTNCTYRTVLQGSDIDRASTGAQADLGPPAPVPFSSKPDTTSPQAVLLVQYPSALHPAAGYYLPPSSPLQHSAFLSFTLPLLEPRQNVASAVPTKRVTARVTTVPQPLATLSSRTCWRLQLHAPVSCRSSCRFSCYNITRASRLLPDDNCSLGYPVSLHQTGKDGTGYCSLAAPAVVLRQACAR